MNRISTTWTDAKFEMSEISQYRTLFRLLNRPTMINFTSEASISMAWTYPDEDKSAMADFLWQIILGKELARRLEKKQNNGYVAGLTPKVFATIIVADLWFKHVQFGLAEMKPDASSLTRADTQEVKGKADDWKQHGNNALSKMNYSKAIASYTEALELDPGNPVYRSNRSAAFCSAGCYDEALLDASLAIHLDANYAKAWSRAGLVYAKLGWWKKALECYKNAVLIGDMSGNKTTDATMRGLREAETQLSAAKKASETETNLRKQDAMRKAIEDQDFIPFPRTLVLYSKIHGYQVAGLLHFATKMKWPYINEVRETAEESYSDHLAGVIIPRARYDWLFGLTLPGQWFALKIMSALITCTLSFKETLNISLHEDSGLSLPTKSYWRIRTSLGRVLGCIPGVHSLGGWLGPCPPVEFDPPLDGKEPRHVRLSSREIQVMSHKPSESNENIKIRKSSHHRDDDLQRREGEELEPYLDEMYEPTNWIIPEPPVQQVSTCELKAIRLTPLVTQELKDQREWQYRAQLIFKMDDSEKLFSFKLYTNPVFITVPPCHKGPKGVHEIHLRELYRYAEYVEATISKPGWRNIWTIEQLKDHKDEDSEAAEVMIINATGKGAEVLARAWCAERGKHAVIRRAGGPCFVCAERAASLCGLGVGVLIWVS